MVLNSTRFALQRPLAPGLSPTGTGRRPEASRQPRALSSLCGPRRGCSATRHRGLGFLLKLPTVQHGAAVPGACCRGGRTERSHRPAPTLAAHLNPSPRKLGEQPHVTLGDGITPIPPPSQKQRRESAEI